MQGEHAIAYASRSLTETEKRYAQIEKEMLSIVFSATKFHRYIYGKEVKVYNDHKPLEQLFKKSLLSAPMRIRKMMIRLQWYDITVIYRKGKEMQVSDTLSRAFLQTENQHSEFDRQEDMINMLSVSIDKYAEIKSPTQTELSALHKVIIDGWPDTRSETPVEVRPYWDSRDQLSVLDGIIYKGLRLVIPPSLRGNMLELIHKSHLGMSKCKQRAREVMYWPCMNSDIDSMVINCTQCNEYQKQQPAEPLKPTPTPDLPYSFVGCDLFDFESKKYLLVVDYYSKYIDVAPLQFENAKAIIEALKPIFACHGIPVKLRSDNGPQFSSNEFKKFCASIGIESETASSKNSRKEPLGLS
ncbi:uncharacterized protein K02A2.6-like [Ylistrum balloti]|uniref:uncharacterized protein K02A2.6-like n=1 Tax=Ylistrum balloti TaxID=509963 RepID=UPI002905D87A|nr:uncharacterized protein K02A2.6-like [Ylistrum balloti]